MEPEADPFQEFEQKMRNAAVSEAAIRAFEHNYRALCAGSTGLIPEKEVQPVTSLPRAESLPPAPETTALLKETVVLKLNGGLGTSMGLDRAKSLLPVKAQLTFLDFIARQLLATEKRFQSRPRFLLMNSFSTSEDTRKFLQRYPELGAPENLELVQNRVPKLDAETLRPAVWEPSSALEWCPPGHGDLYPSLLDSGWLERLLKDGVKYMFVSNSDNLGASLDLSLLHYFATSQQSFMMEVAERTSSDKKGGHLARRNGRFLLRESAQCPEGDLDAFQDIERHRFFNTNNLWLRLEDLSAALRTHGGFIPLPLIRNRKTVDPRDGKSPAVFQIETAMGAAIECFENSGAIVVPRSRFSPVKTTADLLGLRSDAYDVTDDWLVVLTRSGTGQPPKIDLDSKHYKLVEQLDAKTSQGVPSLKFCTELSVRGPVCFCSRNIVKGAVQVLNPTENPQPLPEGTYENTEIRL